jgi:hypothetical protein
MRRAGRWRILQTGDFDLVVDSQRRDATVEDHWLAVLSQRSLDRAKQDPK